MATVGELQQVVQQQEQELDKLRALLEELQQENGRLSTELAALLNRLYRRKSERLDPNQLLLFAKEMLEAVEVTAPPEPEPEASGSPSRPRKKGHGRKPFAPDIVRQDKVLDLPEQAKVCACGKDLVPIGEEITERGHVIPAQVIVKRYIRPKYACPDGHLVKTMPLPPSLIERCKYEPSVYAYVAVAKYGDHLPLHRLQGILGRHGFDLSKSTMWDMLSRLDEVVARPIVARMREELLQEPFLQADETPVTVLLEPKGGSKAGYLWCYGVKKKRAFVFTLSRSRDGPITFLEKWRGIFQTDGFGGYDAVTRRNQLVRAGCWAHARRKFKEALDAGQTAAALVLLPIQRLFWLEAALLARARIQNLEDDALLVLRQQIRERRSPRILKDIQAAAAKVRQDPRSVPRGVLGRALRYLENQWHPLTVFVNHPAAEIHNNDTERALRHVAVGRKNWSFFGSPRGGEVGCSLFSLILACKALNVNPERYLEDIIQRIDTTPASRVASLTPWAWADEQSPQGGRD